VLPQRHAGFTLLEICLALAIGVMIIVLSVPSISGLLAEQRLKRSFERLDALVAAARVRSASEQRAYALVWDREGITLVTRELEEAGAAPEPSDRLVFEDEESFHLRRPAALTKNPPQEWVFWNNGICEPAEVAYEGPAGSWLVQYDALTARGTFLQSDIR
jgi:Tfp pilus assembly protein FimT